MFKTLHVKFNFPIVIFSGKSVSLIVFTMALFTLLSCATTVNFATSTVLPAAEGKVKVKRDNNKNYAVSIEVENLAEPNRLPQPHNAYVVWAETESNGTQILGQLKPSSGLFSSKLKASLETVTPYKPRRIFVTAEHTPTVQTPNYYVVLNTRSF
jgi:hypothetical protein